MEGALFAGNNDFSNIKQYQTLKVIITKITTITCAGCCDGSEPPTEDLTKTYLAIKEGIQMMIWWGFAIFTIIVCYLEVITYLAKNIDNIMEAIIDLSGDFPRTEQHQGCFHDISVVV